MMNTAAIEPLNILVMQHDPILSVGIAAALRQQPSFQVLAQELDPMSTDQPQIHVVVADYGHAMQLADPIVRAGRRHLAAARILALTPNDREADIRRAIEAGVHGYLLLGGALSDLVDGVTAVAAGVRYLCREVAQRMADSMTRVALTSRETEVLRLVVAGESNKMIARRLHIELGTVKSHMTAIMTKLGAASRTQAAGMAVARGLVESGVLTPRLPAASRQVARELNTQFA
jgi:two-component system NarL family response regulator